MEYREQAEALLERIRGDIPLTGHMQLAVKSFDGQVLELLAPLAPNINDKKTAFAGSIGGLATLSGWFLLTLWTAEKVGRCDVAAANISHRFKRPIRGDFHARVSLPDAQELEAAVAWMKQKGRARIPLKISIVDAEGVAAEAEGDYAFWPAAV